VSAWLLEIQEQSCVDVHTADVDGGRVVVHATDGVGGAGAT